MLADDSGEVGAEAEAEEIAKGVSVDVADVGASPQAITTTRQV